MHVCFGPALMREEPEITDDVCILESAELNFESGASRRRSIKWRIIHDRAEMIPPIRAVNKAVQFAK